MATMGSSVITINDLFHSVRPNQCYEDLALARSRGQLWRRAEEQDFDEQSTDSFSSIDSHSSVDSLSSSRSSSSSTSSKVCRYKTERCRQFYETGHCVYGGRCLYAHGQHELKQDPGRPKNFKTRMCTTYHYNGYCTFGPRCAFIHDNRDPIQLMEAIIMASPKLPMPENLARVRPEFYPSDILIRKSNTEMVREEQLLPSRFINDHRLPVFKRITRK